MKKLCFVLLVLQGVCAWQCGFGQTPARGSKPAEVDKAIPVSRDLIASEKLFDSWKLPIQPRRIIGNIYYVGLSGVSSWLITTPEGHILIDSTFEETVPTICSNVVALGFRVGDIKLLLSSHAHADHTGGHALMKARMGARIVASAADARLLESGGKDDFSPFPKKLLAYARVKADQIVKDGDLVTLGGVTLTAHLTPGHTKGATTWTMAVKDGEKTYQVVFFSSVSIVEPTRLVNNPDYPTIAEDYAATFKKLKSLTCDVFLAPHANQFGLAEKLDRLDRNENPNPFIDPDGWHKYLEGAEKAYLKQLEAEKAVK